MEKKLYRNEHDKVIAGISSGLADYMQIDITIIRILFVLSSIFLAGTGVLVYIVMWIIVPVNNDLTVRYKKFNDYYKKNQGTSMFNSPNAFNNPYNSSEQTKWNTENVDPNFKSSTNPDFSKLNKGNDAGRTIVGLVLLILGIYFLLRQFDFIPHWLNIFKIYKLWPLAIVAIGISLIFKNQNKNDWDSFKKTTEEAQKAEETQVPVQDATIIDEEGKPTEQNTQL